MPKLSRRRFLTLSAGAAAAAAAGPGLFFTPRTARADAGAAAANGRRFLHIFLVGGWDSALATDPLVGSKATSAAYDPAYADWAPVEVFGKPLTVGAGLSTAVPAFQALPTAFVNGMTVEVTAHQIATDYLMSGRLAISRNRTYPAMAALMGAETTVYPPHVNLGYQVPLGDTADQKPPLQATNMNSMNLMLAGTNGLDELSPKQGTLDAIASFLTKRNSRFRNRRGEGSGKVLDPWIGADTELPSIYAARYDQQLLIDDAMRARYGTVYPGDGGELLAGAFLTLKCGLSRYVTAAFGNFDTHTDHFPNHPNQMRAFGSTLSALVEDLQATSDPDQPNLSLADTTTLVIGSEFVRTPLLNVANGTDHWQSASAIVMGADVVDGAIIGATDDDANPVDSNLLPEHLCASIVSRMGFEDAANTISEERISGLFVA